MLIASDEEQVKEAGVAQASVEKHHTLSRERVWDTDTLNQWVNYISLAWMQFLSVFYSYLAFALLGNLCFMGSLDNILYCLLLTHR